MMKLNYYTLLLLYAPIINMLMIILMMLPSKNYKFHPINLMIMLIMMIFFLSNKMNFMIKSLMPFILFLIMIGGLMIIFMYITSLSNNQIFMNQHKNNLIMITKIMIFSLTIMFLMNFLMNSLNLTFNPYEYWPLTSLMEKINEFNLSNLFNSKKKLTLFIMTYLFYTMICIMNICYKINTPLRQINHYE